VPSGSLFLNTWASVHSKKLVDMPIRPMTHIQKTAPGPPSVMATATPAMLPAPTRPATLRASAWNELTCPGWWWNACLRTRNISPKCRI